MSSSSWIFLLVPSGHPHFLSVHNFTDYGCCSFRSSLQKKNELLMPEHPPSVLKRCEMALLGTLVILPSLNVTFAKLVAPRRLRAELRLRSKRDWFVCLLTPSSLVVQPRSFCTQSERFLPFVITGGGGVSNARTGRASGTY